MYIFASITMLLAVALVGSGLITMMYNIIHNNPEKLYPLVDGILLAYIVAYFAFIYRG